MSEQMAQLLFENTDAIPEGLYLQLMNSLKIIHDNEQHRTPVVTPMTEYYRIGLLNHEANRIHNERIEQQRITPVVIQTPIVTQTSRTLFYCGFYRAPMNKIIEITNKSNGFLSINEMISSSYIPQERIYEYYNYENPYYKMKQYTNRTKIFINENNVQYIKLQNGVMLRASEITRIST